MRLIISFAALLLSIALVQLSSGSLGPLDALSGVVQGFSTTQIGLLGSAHFVGFFVGCWWAPRLMGSIGHVRGFAVFAALGAIGVIAHPMWVSPLAWAGMRVMSGLAIAGVYTIVEAWINAKVDNVNRGRIFGAYRFVDLGSSLVAQLLIGFLEPASYVSYNLLAIFCCACLLPLTLTTSKAPQAPAAPRLRPLKAIKLSPLAAAGICVAGVTTPAFRMVGPLYGQEVGLRADQIGLFLAAAVLGGALAQLPIGWIADKFDRRHVLIGLSLAATLVSFGTILGGTNSVSVIFVAAFAFGLTTFPIFSVSAAHANDHAPPDFIVELSAALMFLYGAGAIASPLFASWLMAHFGAKSLFVFIATAHIVLAIFSIYPMRVRPRVGERTPYAYVPRTSFIFGRMLKRKGSNGAPEDTV